MLSLLKLRNLRTIAVIIGLSLPVSLVAIVTPQKAQAGLLWAGVTGTLSLVPGLGQLTNGDYFESLAWFGLTTGLWLTLPGVALDMHMYQMYDAYRDAEPKDKKYTNHNFFNNYFAFYNPLNVFDAVGAPLLVGYGVLPGYQMYQFKNLTPLKVLSVSFIGLGEEGLFRGFLFPGFSSLFFDSAWAGAIVSSTLFGLAHYTYSPAEQTMVGLFGLVECWQLHRNKYDLRNNIFAHSWVDFFLLPKDQGPIEDTLYASSKIPPIGVRLNFAF